MPKRNARKRSAKDTLSRTRLPSSDVRWNCESIRRSAKPPKTSVLLGQPRAIRALRTGLELYAPGFNIFASGLLGSGRMRIVRNLLEELRPACRLGPDLVFVHNVRDPSKPRLITLPRGRAVAFREEVRELGRNICETLQQSLKSRRHRASRKLVIQDAEGRRERLFRALGREAARDGMAIVQVRSADDESAADVLPLRDGKAIPIAEFERLVAAGEVGKQEGQRVLRQRSELLERLEDVSERIRAVYRDAHRELREIDRRLTKRNLEGLADEFCQRWTEPEVATHLGDLLEHIVRDYPEWIGDGGGEDADEESLRAGAPVLPPRLAAELRVHVIKGEQSPDCPVIVESNPTYPNLFGTIEPDASGVLHDTGVGRIHPGALLRADGGYLILRAADLLSEPGVWRILMRALKTQILEVREYDANAGTTMGSLQPEAIPIDVKVVMIGEPGLFESLCEQDPHFPSLFKVHAEFEATVANTVPNRRRYADFLAWLTEGERLGRLDAQAVAAVVEFGAREAGRRTRLSTHFGELADVVREAAYLARTHGLGSTTTRRVRRDHVEAALEARSERANLMRDQVDREFADGYVLMRTSGTAVGVVNALTVLESQSDRFGKPVRVTATAGRARKGRSDVVSIEREAEMSGSLHDKGVLILEGFFTDRFGRERVLGLSATVCFEQLYTGLDGDSASCAELVALLSAISGLPVKQSLAITGSMNQLGDVQPVGGVNEKIEGFYRLCSARRRTGSQGVIIPRANVEDLMLEHAVVDAVARGRFHVHAIDSVSEAVELLFGRDPEQVFERVAKELETTASPE